MKIVAKKIFKKLSKDIKADLNVKSVDDLLEKKSDEWKYLVYAYEILTYVRLSNNLGTAILLAIYKFMLTLHSMDDPIWYNTASTNKRFDLDKSLDFALCQNLLPQIEKLSPVKLISIRDFVRGRIENSIWNKDLELTVSK